MPRPPNCRPSHGRANVQCQVCGSTVADELDSYEVLVREVRHRNVPTTQLRVCKRCALAIAHGIDLRVEAMRKSPPENS
jgi:hypothetical protein